MTEVITPSVETSRHFVRLFDTSRLEVSAKPVSLSGRETDSSTVDSNPTDPFRADRVA